MQSAAFVLVENKDMLNQVSSDGEFFMFLANKVLSREHRLRAREIARQCWCQSGFYEPRAVSLTRQVIAADKAKGTYGNPLMALMIAFYIAQLCYIAYKVWRDMKMEAPPEKSFVGEPFGLDGGE